MMPLPVLLCILLATGALAFPNNVRDVGSKNGGPVHEVQPRMFAGGYSEEPDQRPGYVTSGQPGSFQHGPDASNGDVRFISLNQIEMYRENPPSYPLAPPLPPPVQEDHNEGLEGSAEGIEGLYSLQIKESGPLNFFVEDGVLYEQLMYSNGLSAEPQVYKPFTGREKQKTKFEQARYDAYQGLGPQGPARLDRAISMQLRTLRAEQSLASRSAWNTANQMIPNAQQRPVGGVTYDFGSGATTPKANQNPQWGPVPRDRPTWSSSHMDVWNFLNPWTPPTLKRNMRKRQSVLDKIDNSEAKGNSTASLTAEFQVYLNAYQTVQANISDSLFPFFNSVLNGTNNSLIYDIVWSVYSDLTGLGPQIIGPFSYGMHCFDWMEEAYLNSTRNSTNNTASNNTSSITNGNSTGGQDPVYQQMLATHYTLIEIYDYVWTNASAIANRTGLLRDLVILSEYLTPADPSIMSAAWTSLQSFDDSYFTAYNTTH